jgi:hypothetical protein
LEGVWATSSSAIANDEALKAGPQAGGIE